MIKEIEIRNYKTLLDAKLSLGRLNVVIGVNGSGKSNLTEAIALGVAGAQEKLDAEYLSARGVRLTHPKFMKSAFEKNDNAIEIDFHIKHEKEKTIKVRLENDNKPYSKWKNVEIARERMMIDKVLYYFLDPDNRKEDFPKELTEALDEVKKDVEIPSLKKMYEDEEGKDFFKSMLPHFTQSLIESYYSADFVIYKPEETFLRRFDTQGHAEPLGKRGEGLLKLLTVYSSERPEVLEQIKHHLQLFDWFKDIKLKDQLFEKDVYFDIEDKFLDSSLGYFDQRSANEGFLYLAFYISLFLSNTAPQQFAIDNIDNSLNPKLCTELVRLLSRLAVENDKQAILTTHNPAILDGLDLNDPNQKLFVLSRKRDGSTKIRQIDSKPKSEGLMKLSEMFMAGMLGGIPKNFA